MTRFVCIGVPYWLGRPCPTINAVAIIQVSGLAAEMGAPWIEIEPDFAAAPDPVTAVNRALAATIAAHADALPLIFAADCVACVGAVRGLAAHDPGVIWYDAHGDFNTPETTPSGFLGGMPLAALVGRGNADLLAGVGLAPLAERDILITDARDLDPEEGVQLRASQVTHLPEVTALLTAALPAKPLYIHFDTDVINLAEMPAMSYPAAGGPTLADTIATLRRIIRDGQVVGVLFSLWNAELPDADTAAVSTLQVARAIVQELRA